MKYKAIGVAGLVFAGLALVAFATPPKIYLGGSEDAYCNGGLRYLRDSVTPVSSLMTNLVAYWNLDELSGTRAKTAGSCTTCDLTVTNAPLALGGVGSYSALLTGTSSQAFTVADNASLSVTGEFMTCTWVRGVSGGDAIIHKQNAGGTSREYHMYFTATNGAAFTVGDGGATVQTATPATFTAGGRYLMCGWWSSADSKVRMSVNAGTPGVSSGTITPGDGANPVYFGHQLSTYLTGGIGPSYFWKGSFPSDSDVYNGGRGYSCAGLPAALRVNMTACWDLDEASGSRLNESWASCGSACDLTAVNTPTRIVGVVPNPNMGMGVQTSAGSSSYFATTAAPAMASRAFTVNVWMNMAATSSTCVVMGRYTGANAASSFVLYPNGTSSALATVNGTTQASINGPSFAYNTWYMWTASRPADASAKASIRLQAGTPVLQVSAVGMNLATAEFTFSKNGTAYCNGVFDSPGYWEGRELTNSEVVALYAAGVGTEYPWSNILAFLNLGNPDQRWASVPRYQKQIAVYSETGVWVPEAMIPTLEVR